MQFFRSFGHFWLFMTLTSILISGIELTKYEIIEGKVYEVTEGENCFRECDPNIFKICEFDFSASWWHTLNSECNNCPKNLKDCFNVNCISADGNKRLVQVINKQLPGPSIQVCENDVIRVKVKNNLQHGSGLSIHWHGIHQVGTQFNDGVPYVTQCYIDYMGTFQYEFKAHPAGTHFWHSHSGLQIGDGLHGALIVRKPSQLEKNRHLYDEDLADHYLLVHTYHEMLIEAAFHTLLSSGENIYPSTILINGRAQRIKNDGYYTPLTTYSVVQGKRYKFQLIHVGGSDCRSVVTFEYHKIIVIATEVGEIQPITVDRINLDAGQRFDIVIEAYNDIGNYYITVIGEVACNDLESRAILSYEGAKNSLPFETPQLLNRPLLLNFLGLAQRFEYDTIFFSEILSLDYDPLVKEDPDIVLYFYLKNVAAPDIVPGSQFKSVMNDIAYMEPKNPLWLMNQSTLQEQSCTVESLREKNIDCTRTLCECAHLYHIPLDSNVEIVLLAHAPGEFAGNHPMHLHGSSFKVVSMGTFSSETTITDFKEMDGRGKFHRNLLNPPEADTIAFPNIGYTIIRFTAKNPGWWLFHCHIEFHIQWGMQVTFVVGGNQNFPIPPAGYPTCGQWTGG